MATPTVASVWAPFSVTVDPSGQYAYVTTYGSDTVSQFTIGADGSLSAMEPPTVAAGSGPVFVTVDPRREVRLRGERS